LKGPFDLWYALTSYKRDDPDAAATAKEDWSKFLAFWVKTIIVIIVATSVVVGIIGIGSWTWNLFHKKSTPQNSTNTSISGPTGSATQNIKYTVVQIADRGKAPVKVIPYIDVNTGYSNGREDFASSNYGWEVVGGVRMEFDGLLDLLFGGKKTETQQVQTAITAAESVKDSKDFVNTVNTKPISK
jgi:hypothetical protein